MWLRGSGLIGLKREYEVDRSQSTLLKTGKKLDQKTVFCA
jgi:hypothetical protein